MVFLWNLLTTECGRISVGWGNNPSPLVISQLQAGNPHLRVPRKLALDDHSVGKSKQKWASKFQETQTWSSMRSLAKKPTISEAVKPCIRVDPRFPQFLVVSDLCFACLHSLSEQIWQHSPWEGLSRSTFSIMFQHLPQKPCKCAKSYVPLSDENSHENWNNDLFGKTTNISPN